MERTKTNTEPKQIRWKKTGGGSFRLGNRIIKPGQTFSATEAEIPQAFRDVVIPSGSIPAAKPTPVIIGAEPGYKLKSRGTGRWYDVVNAKGKAINEKALKKEVAEKLLQDLAK